MLTDKGAATRARIIEGAAQELRDFGVTGTTLEDVMARTRTSKSQLFHYFPEGKEALLLAVAEHEAQRVIEDQQPALSQLTTWRAWRQWRDLVVARYLEQGQQCPLHVVTSGLGRSSPGARAVTTQLLRRWQADIEVGIRSMQASGKVSPRVDAGRASAALLAGIQGGVLIWLTTGEIGHLEAALDSGIAALRS